MILVYSPGIPPRSRKNVIIKVFMIYSLTSCSSQRSSMDVNRHHLISDHLSTEAMTDKNLPLVHEVCSDCFRACPQDLSLRYILPHRCRSPGFHCRADRVFVTCFKGVLVRVPPPDNVMAGLRGRFVMCQAGQKCKRSRCSYPHTEEERDFWNSALEDFKGIYMYYC